MKLTFQCIRRKNKINKLAKEGFSDKNSKEEVMEFQLSYFKS